MYRSLKLIYGKIRLINIEPGTKLKVKEVKAPEGYEATEEIVEQVVANSSSTYNFNIKNGKLIQNVNIVKTDVNGNTILTNSTYFEIYNESGELLRFKNYPEESNSNGRTYRPSSSGDTRVITQRGKIKLLDMPVGTYRLKEVVAPQGYMKLDDDVIFKVISTLTNGLSVSVKDPYYEFGSEGYVSLSYQKIMERENSDNYGYGFAKANDSENFIAVLSKDDIVNYTLKVANNSNKTFKKLVLINKLADINDTGTVNQNSKRNSDFRMSLINTDDIVVNMYDEQGRGTPIEKSLYKIEFSDSTQYDDDDWNGISNENWSGDVLETTKSFRVAFNNDFELPSTYSIAVLFDGEISEEAKPGNIGWNSFGYRYYVDGTDLTAEPPKVGVMIAQSPKIIKEVIYNEEDETASGDKNREFEFEIFEEGIEEPIKVIKLRNGETKELELKRMSGDQGFIELGKTYIVKEKEVEGYTIKNTTINKGEAYESSVEFVADPKDMIEIKFTNEKDYVQVEEPSGDPVVEEPSGEKPVVEPSGEEPVVEPSGDKENNETKPNRGSGGSSRTRKISKNVEIEIIENTITPTPTPEERPTVTPTQTEMVIQVTELETEPTLVPTTVSYTPTPTEIPYVISTVYEELPKTGDNIYEYVITLITLLTLGIVVKKKIN